MSEQKSEARKWKRVQASFLFSVFCFLAAPLLASATTITGAIKRPDGTPVSGTIEFVLSQPAKTITPPQIFVPVRTTCAVTNGSIAAGCTVQGNDTLDPAGTYYRVRVLDANNVEVWPFTNYTITGTVVDIASLPVTASATLVPPTGSVTGNMNVTGNLTVGGAITWGADPQLFGHLRFAGFSADPGTAAAGSTWYRSDLDSQRFRAGKLELWDGTQFVDLRAQSTNILETGAAITTTNTAGIRTKRVNFTRWVDPDLWTEATVPAKIDAAIADCAGAPCLVALPSNLGAGESSNVPANVSLLDLRTGGELRLVGSLSAREINNVRYADQFAGADAGAKIAAAIADLPATGGVVDARGLEGAQSFSSNPFAGVNKPITLLTGAATITWNTESFFVDLPDDFIWIGHGTTLRASPSGVGGYSSSNIGLLITRKTQTTGSISSGSNTLTVADATNFAVGKLVVVLGAAGGESRQRTTVADGGDGIDASQTTIGVVSTAGSGGGYIRVDNEIMSYAGTTGTSFTGLVRGVFGTTAATHAEGANVDTVPYFWSEITGVSGTTLTLADNATTTVSGAPVIIGSKNIKLLGDITLDGNQNRGAAAPAVNQVGLDAKFARFLYVAPTVKFTNFAHNGVSVIMCRDFDIGGIYVSNTRPADGLGMDVRVGGRNLRGRVRTTSHYDSYGGVWLDGRSTNYVASDGAAEKVIVELGPHETVSAPFIIDSGNDNTAYLGHVKASVVGPQILATQWTTNPVPSRNVIYFGSINSSSVAIDVQSSAAGGSNRLIGGLVEAGTVTISSGNYLEYADSSKLNLLSRNFNLRRAEDAAFTLDFDSGLTAAQSLILRLLDRGSAEYSLQKNSSNNFVIGDKDGISRFIAFRDSHTELRPGETGTGFRIQFNQADGTTGIVIDPAALRQYFGTTSGNTYIERVGTSQLRTDSRLEVDGKLQPDSGIDPNSGGFKHARVSTGSIAASSSAAVTVTWTSAFADANYTPICSVQEATAGTASLRVHHIQSIAAGSIVVRVVNDNTSSALTGTLVCQAVHD